MAGSCCHAERGVGLDLATMKTKLRSVHRPDHRGYRGGEKIGDSAGEARPMTGYLTLLGSDSPLLPALFLFFDAVPPCKPLSKCFASPTRSPTRS